MTRPRLWFRLTRVNIIIKVVIIIVLRLESGSTREKAIVLKLDSRVDLGQYSSHRLRESM
jgi:hypothetical protein